MLLCTWLAPFCSSSGKLPPSDEFQSLKNVAKSKNVAQTPTGHHVQDVGVSVFATQGGGQRRKAVCPPMTWVTHLCSEARDKQTDMFH